jgi:hypothetical protein
MTSPAARIRPRSDFRRYAIRSAYGAALFAFLLTFARFYHPEAGFSYLIDFGAQQDLPQISEFADLTYSLQTHGYGYDAQYYVQLAMHPSLRDPELPHAIDNLSYRARRILFCWSAYLLGLGEPEWILQAYAVQNALAWIALAGVLLWWFPPTSWSNFLRWIGVLFCGGMCWSVRSALIDGPSLLLIALGVLCVEKNRPWLATAFFGLGTLGRETNALAAASLVNVDQRSPRDLLRLGLQAILVAAPLLLWLGYIQFTVGSSVDAGTDNFELPLLAYFTKWRDTLTALSIGGITNEPARLSVLLLVALTVQCLFLFLRPSLRQPWWRIGVLYALLAILLGRATWEGHPGAAGRLLLPMQLAFNILVPYGRRWLGVLVLGNITLIGAPMMLTPPVGEGYRVERAPALQSSESSIRVSFDRGWFSAEKRDDRIWRWCQGNASFSIINRQSHPLTAELSFYIDALETRHVTVLHSPQHTWAGDVQGEMTKPIVLGPLTLQPGENVFTFTSPEPAGTSDGDDRRSLAFALRNFQIRLSAPAK